MELSEVVKDAY